MSTKPQPPDFMKNLRIEPQMVDSLPLIQPVPSAFFPQSLPLSYGVAAMPGSDGKLIVALQITTPGGMQFYFLAPDAGKQLGEAILAMARVAETGIVPAGIVPAP